MIRLVELPFCAVVMLDDWSAPSSRYFAAYRCSGSHRGLLGHPVVDEFATISSPIFLTPKALLGKIYNAGLSLGHLRDPEMGIDLGWPPLCVGLDQPAPELPEDWESRLLEAIQSPRSNEAPESKGMEVQSGDFRNFTLESVQSGEATVIVTSAPLLPKQLSRLCEAAPSLVVVTVSIGNRLEPVASGSPRTVNALSQKSLAGLFAVVQELVH